MGTKKDKCIHCGAETTLYVFEKPICPKCDKEREEKKGKNNSTDQGERTNSGIG
jgi:hypothetical protein